MVWLTSILYLVLCKFEVHHTSAHIMRCIHDTKTWQCENLMITILLDSSSEVTVILLGIPYNITFVHIYTTMIFVELEYLHVRAGTLAS